jgi:hypothetical protein
MPTFTFPCDSEAELATLRQAAHFISEMHRLAQGAGGGEVLSAVESLALSEGRQLLRDVLQSAVQARVDAGEKKGAACAAAAGAPARAGSRAGTAAT